MTNLCLESECHAGCCSGIHVRVSPENNPEFFGKLPLTILNEIMTGAVYGKHEGITYSLSNHDGTYQIRLDDNTLCPCNAGPAPLPPEEPWSCTIRDHAPQECREFMYGGHACTKRREEQYWRKPLVVGRLSTMRS